jgi:V/A-type H+-transporting ATPase subunit I
MIVPMIKYSFLVYHNDYPEFLKELKKTGVVHIQKREKEPSPEMQDLYRKISDIKQTIKGIETISKNSEKPTNKHRNLTGEELYKQIQGLYSDLELLRQQKAVLEKEIKLMEPWGDFSLELLHNLENSGFIFKFLTTSIRKYDPEWEKEHYIKTIGDFGGTRYFVLIRTSKDETIKIELPNTEEIKLPERSLSQLQTEMTKNHEHEKELKSELIHIAHFEVERLELFFQQLSEEVEEMNVIRQTAHQAEGAISLVEGWAPESNTSQLNTYLEENNILYVQRKPEQTDDVPVLLKNNKFAKMFEFIGELYDLPNYKERDLTMFFAPFYVIFFGLCLGDAGYGLIFLFLGLFARSKVKEPVMKQVMSLLSILGGATIIMGIISGTFFGIPLLESTAPWIQKFKFIMLDSNKLFYNALIIGVIQILFGMILKWTGEIKRSGFFGAISTLGWLLILIGVGGTFALSKFATISPEIAKLSYIIFGSLGGICVFLLNNIKRNPIINVGAGIWDSYNMATGLLGDILSYIRLFALGLSGGVMGFVFNDLAISMSGNIGIPVVSQLVALFILLFGHGINIFIAALGSFVHPMRLTFVEFYKNSGFEGGGKKYKPFAKYKKEVKVI